MAIRASTKRELKTTPSTRLKRHPERGTYERDALYSILDEALICHIGFVVGKRPFVIPTIHARLDDQVYLHGAAASRMLGALRKGVEVCLTVTLLDGLVMARSAFSHSMNYRSAMVLGVAVEVTEPAEKMTGFEAVVEHVAAGRWAECRRPSRKEMLATRLLRLPIDEASAKIRTGPPKDDEQDLGWPVWAGVLPLRLVPGDPIPDPALAAGVVPPGYLTGYRRPDA